MEAMMASSPCDKEKTRQLSAAARHQDLPDVIIEEILARMPAKSVLRCRCLSRAWAATLSSDAFVDRHLDLANRRHREEVPRLCFLPASAATSTVFAWSPELGKGACFTPLMAVPHNSRNGKLHAVTGTCRGVLLLRATDARMYYLCNPSMGQIAALPDGRMAGHPFPRSDYASLGLGYDARSRSHKVVRLLYHDGQPAGCDIYDVGAGARSTGHWRPAAGGGGAGVPVLPPGRVRMNQMGVFVEGHVHWPTMDHGADERIISFSMADEKFGYVAPPPASASTSVARFMLAELGGFLCLFSAPKCLTSSLESIEIWLLTDYATGSWEKHWRIDLTKLPPPPPELGDDFMFEVVAPLALVDGGRRILFVSREYQVAAYCLATGTLEEVVSSVPGGFRGQHHLLVPYEESLVPAGRPFQDILWSSPPARALSVALRRLPARTLGRLKLVCRSWRAMLETDRFVTLHDACARAAAAAAATPVSVAFLDHFGAARTPYPDLPVEVLERELLGPPVVSLESSSCSGDPGAGRRWNNLPLSTTRVVCRAPCHGLVLLSHQSGNCHVLCNPVTRASRGFVFPDPDQGGDGGCAGLGYDPSREEHVVVRLSYQWRCLETRTYAMECWVWPERDLCPRTLGSQPPIPAAVDVPPVHVGGKMYWPREPRLGTAAAAEFAILALDVRAETFEVVPAPPALSVLGDVDGGDRVVLAELAGKLCAVNLSATMETMTVWGKNVDGWRREHVIELQRWPEFSPRTTTELAVMPMAVDPVDGRILLDTGKALGYYDTRSGTLQTVYSLKERLDCRYCSCGDDVFFIATVCEDSLLRPCQRKSRFW